MLPTAVIVANSNCPTFQELIEQLSWPEVAQNAKTCRSPLPCRQQACVDHCKRDEHKYKTMEMTAVCNGTDRRLDIFHTYTFQRRIDITKLISSTTKKNAYLGAGVMVRGRGRGTP